jgi:phytoene dehydrogenase-like protein
MSTFLKGVLLLAVLAGLAHGAETPPPAPAPAAEPEYLKAKPEDLRWWQEARFGMFIHWGSVSLKGTEIGWSRGGKRGRGGGTGAIPEAFVRSIEKRGGKVHLSQAVERIKIENGRATGVILPGGKEIPADIVISNADIKTSVLDLVGAEKYAPAFVEKVKDYTWSEATFIVKVALDRKITNEKLIMYLNPDNIVDVAMLILQGGVPDKAPILMIPVISNLDPTACPEGKQLILSGAACRTKLDSPASVWKQWEEAYMRTLYGIFPGMEKHVLWVEATSPKWIDNLFGEGGNVVGVGQTLKQVGPNRPPIVDPLVKNFYHCSADSGWQGIGGELASDAAMRLYRMLSKG